MAQDARLPPPLRRSDRNARLIRLTEPGWRLYERVAAVAATIEAEWAQQVGALRLEELRATLSAMLNRESGYLWLGCVRTLR
jgi:DNA-binding MarR family transcriptional regulator